MLLSMLLHPLIKLLCVSRTRCLGCDRATLLPRALAEISATLSLENKVPESISESLTIFGKDQGEMLAAMGNIRSTIAT